MVVTHTHMQKVKVHVESRFKVEEWKQMDGRTEAIA